MKSFITDVLDDILKSTSDFKDVVFILPSQRAKVFLKHEIRKRISNGFLPEVLNVEEFIQQVSGFEKIDNLQLLFNFYAIYKAHESNPDDFDVFSSWAITVLQDYNEIDQHLVDAKQIFTYVRDIQRLRNWRVDDNFNETKLIKKHYDFLERLYDFYQELYKFLKKKKVGYQGVLYREACNEIDTYIESNSHKQYYFLGFNALNKAEEFLFQKVLENGKSDIYWDIDEAFLEGNHQAGKFIRQYKTNWKFYDKHKLKSVQQNFNQPKIIEIIGAPKNTTQVKYAGELLSGFDNFNHTAVVLADETLLPITLNSLPKKIDAINITMGYPLKDIPVSQFIFSFIQLYLSQHKLNRQDNNEFYFKDATKVLKHPFIYKNLENVDVFLEEIAKNNLNFINEKTITKGLKKQTEVGENLVDLLFKKHTSILEFLDRVIAVINNLKNEVTALEKEYLFRFYTIFQQLKKLQTDFSYFKDLKTINQFLRQLVSAENLSFQGEPLKGLQLMGMLETRVLDFENVILLSANEGILPAGNSQKSFIPFDVKLDFNLPTYREKDAIFSYHFFRLLQRAKNIFILHNTESDNYGNGEKSRFVTQLEMLKKDAKLKIVSPKIISQKKELKTIVKDDFTLSALKKIAQKGISPSALTSYLHNPIAFYKQKVLGLKELDEVEENIAYNTLGTVVHNTLDDLYTPFVGKFLSTVDIDKMETQAKELIVKYFKKEFVNGDINTGKNRLIFEVANRFVFNFLKQEKELVSNANNALKILATEETLATEIQVDGIDFPIKIHGQVDRVDELNGVLRIIDYKTGKVEAKNLKVSNFDSLREEDHLKAIQVLLYAYLYTSTKNFDFSKELNAGIYSFKNLNAGFIPIDFSEPRKKRLINITQESLDFFLAEIKKYIQEIYNPTVIFEETADLKY